MSVSALTGSDPLPHFAANLRFLCERHGSISQICRNIRINRQQFNKYLAGSHRPSAQNVRLIANYFGLSASLLYSDHEEFRALTEGNYFQVMDALRQCPKVTTFLEATVLDKGNSAKDLVGVYDRYQYSSIYRGRILRAAFCLYECGDFLQHYYVERFPSFDNPEKADFVFKYYGFTIPLGDRLFSCDFECVQRNELTFGIYAPVVRSSKNFLFGITSGIAASVLRPPFSTKLAMHYRGRGLLTREHLARVTALERNDRSIPAEILQFLDSDEMEVRR